MPPELVNYITETEYRQHYESIYSRGIHHTFDGFRVFFSKQQFNDAFFESANRRARDKSIFSRQRAERIDWIGTALREATSELYAGWDRNKKQINKARRVCLVYGDYVVVLQVNRAKQTANFITVYIADQHMIASIRQNPRWVPYVEGSIADKQKPLVNIGPAVEAFVGPKL